MKRKRDHQTHRASCCEQNSHMAIQQNALLASFPPETLLFLMPHLEQIYLQQGDVICSYLARSEYIYFPTTCVISLLLELQDGQSTELAIVGREGVVGCALLMGGNYASRHAIVQSTGVAYRIKAQQLQREFDKGTGLQERLLLYTQAQISQISQIAVCNRLHTIEQQFIRWLLLNLDRISTMQLNVTHELIANRLGVRRESITEAARKLLTENIIHYARGKILVIDRPSLETKSCECYSVIKCEYHRLLTRPMR